MENKKEELNKFEKLAGLYNSQRINKQGQKFTSMEIMKLIKFIPNTMNHMAILLKYKLVVKNLDGSYSFPKERAFWNIIKNCSEEGSRIQKEYADRYKANKKLKKVENTNPIQEILNKNGISLDAVAKFLAETGDYQVLKKEVSWNQI